jgi:hypothetical protein
VGIALDSLAGLETTLRWFSKEIKRPKRRQLISLKDEVRSVIHFHLLAL